MAHAGPATFARIPELLAELRARQLLQEKRPGVFYLKSRAFLHFHDGPEGIVADVRLADDFERIDVTAEAGQLELLDRIDERLASVETRSRTKRTSKRRKAP